MAIRSRPIDGKIVITGANDRGVLYGAFALLRKVALGESIAKLDESSEPRVPVRWVNHWDNLDGIDRARLRRTVDLLGQRDMRVPISRA